MGETYGVHHPDGLFHSAAAAEEWRYEGQDAGDDQYVGYDFRIIWVEVIVGGNINQDYDASCNLANADQL
jgi:hypothetical protein